MNVEINQNQLSMTGFDGEESFIATTQLSEQEKQELTENRAYMTTLLKQDREWKITFPQSNKKGYMRIGCLPQQLDDSKTASIESTNDSID